MILLTGGYGVQHAEWKVHEPVAAGYSRVYGVESGDIRYEENGLTRMLVPGRLYLFPAATPYSMTRITDRPFCCLYFHMDMFPIGFPSVVEVTPEPQGMVADFWQLLRLLFVREQAETGFGRMVMHAFGTYLEQTFLPETRAPMGEAAAYIRAHYRDSGINVNSISAHFGCTPAHFIRTFAKAMGVTPYQYLFNMRMYEARRLLLENHSVQETAALVGYDNPRTFSHAFQKKYAISPDLFRRSFWQAV